MRSTLIVLAAVLLCGCGSGSNGDGDSDGDGDGGKSAYIASAEAICSDANRSQEAQAVPTSAGGFAPYVRKVVEIASTASGAVGALQPPAQDSARLREKFLDPLARQVEAGRAYADKVEKAETAGDQAELLRLVGQAPTTPEVDLEFVRQYGMPACAKAADTSS